MGRKLMVAALVAITALYCWGLFWIAWGFARAGGAVGWGLALGIAILLLLTVWVTWREVLFGMATARLTRAYDGPVPVRPTAAARRAAETGHSDGPSGDGAPAPPPTPREEFDAAKAQIESASQEHWQDWYRLALAYEAMRDRKDARMALRRAIDLESAQRGDH